MPYFEGDFWPNILEDCIKELEQEQLEKRRREEEAAADTLVDFEPLVGDSIEVLSYSLHIASSFSHFVWCLRIVPSENYIWCFGIVLSQNYVWCLETVQSQNYIWCLGLLY